MNRPGVRLAELVGVLSPGTDLGLGRPTEHVLCQTAIATRLADRVGSTDADRGDPASSRFHGHREPPW